MAAADVRDLSLLEEAMADHVGVATWNGQEYTLDGHNANIRRRV